MVQPIASCLVSYPDPYPTAADGYITAMWKELDQFGSDKGQFYKPFSVIVDQRDRLIVADHWNHRVVLLDEAGTWLSTIEDNDHPFKNPYGLALDPQGNIHVAAYGSNCIGPMSDHMGMSSVQLE